MLLLCIDTTIFNFLHYLTQTSFMKRCNNCGWFNIDSVARCEKCDEESFEQVVETTTEPDPIVETVENEVIQPEPVVDNQADAVMPNEDVKSEVIVVTDEEHVVSARKKASFSNATVAFNGYSKPNDTVAKMEVPETKDRKNLVATVMDASAAINGAAEVLNCPKCRYPMSGHNEYCPNCGATIRRPGELKMTQRVAPTPEPQVVSQPAEVSAATVLVDVEASPKATVAIEDDKPYVPGAEPKPMPTVPLNNLKATMRDIPGSLISNDTDSSAESQPAPKQATQVNAFKATVRDFVGPNVESKPESVPSAKSAQLKATIRDIPSSLVTNNVDCYRLVPVDGFGEAIIELNLGEVVTIAGKRYRFEK